MTRLRPAQVAAVLVLLASAGLRIGDLGRRSLWYDEAWAALDCIDGPFRLADIKTMPVAFCGLVRGLAQGVERTETIVRLPAAVAGAGATVLTFLAARATLSLPAAVLAATIVGLFPIPVYFGKELKPYAIETLLAAGVVCVTALARRRESGMPWVGLLLLLAVGCGFSFVTPVMVLGAFVALVPELRRRPVRFAAASCVAALVVGAWTVWVYLPQRAAQPEIGAYWHLFYLDPGPWFDMVRAVLRSMGEAATFGLGVEVPRKAERIVRIASLPAWATGVGLAAMALGATHLARSGQAWLVGLTMTWHAALVVGAFGHRYPYGPSRLALFLLVPTSLLLAAGVDAVVGSLSPRLRRLGWGLVAVPLVLPLLGTWQENLAHPFEREELRPVLAELARRTQATDAWWVSRGATFAFRFYRPDAPGEVHFAPLEEGPQSVQSSLLRAAVSGEGRVWAVFSHFGPPQELAVRRALLGKAQIRDEIRATGAAAVLWELGGG